MAALVSSAPPRLITPNSLARPLISQASLWSRGKEEIFCAQARPPDTKRKDSTAAHRACLTALHTTGKAFTPLLLVLVLPSTLTRRPSTDSFQGRTLHPQNSSP